MKIIILAAGSFYSLYRIILKCFDELMYIDIGILKYYIYSQNYSIKRHIFETSMESDECISSLKNSKAPWIIPVPFHNK